MLILLVFVLGWVVLLTGGVGLSTLQGPPRAAPRWWILHLCVLATAVAALVLAWRGLDAHCGAHPSSRQCPPYPFGE
ncbi:hypothetical protein OV320_2026 [Actinobacteria bacterium OV320]|uniref:hypothetical protein n=1 Tax=Streptomyces sp. NBC_00723 TaxID=2903673 RepID=UPI0006BA9F01|nr:hypothetical protein OV320_2026 [Actinobacteria bacterium OV320]